MARNHHMGDKKGRPKIGQRKAKSPQGTKTKKKKRERASLSLSLLVYT
jgi:hypothetical protein